MKRIGQFYLDTKNQCLTNGQTATTLSAKAFQILDALSTKAGQLVTHDELLDAVWHETHVQPEVLKVYTSSNCGEPSAILLKRKNI